MHKQLHNVALTVAFVAGFFVFTMALSLGNDPVRPQDEGRGWSDRSAGGVDAQHSWRW